LYFLDEEKQKLVPVYRSVVYKNGISIVKLAVEQIIEGPNTDSVNSTIPPDTKVNSVDIKDGVCYIDFSSEFLSEPLDVDPSLALYSVIDTVTEFPEVDSVVFSVDGESDFIFRDFEITGPYKRNTDYIK
ncbi:MAG: GerMN domain-containing protein, partial [Butyrivibrio sp.]|nr:GerMN domain-containing protein [Butyrivibrio sp.]